MRKVFNESMAEILGVHRDFSTQQMLAFYLGILGATLLSFVLPWVY